MSSVEIFNHLSPILDFKLQKGREHTVLCLSLYLWCVDQHLEHFEYLISECINEWGLIDQE